MKNLQSKLVSSAALCITMLIGTSSFAADKPSINGSNKPTAIPGTNLDLLRKKPLPDFYLLAVTNKHTSGPKGILRYGSCANDFRVIVKNLGIKYTYGDKLSTNSVKPGTVKGGQVLVHLEKFQGNKLTGYHTKFINQMNANQVINVDFVSTNPGHFPTKGTYKIKATVIPCAQGASTTNCNLFPEENSNNNSSTVSYTVTSACP